MDGQNFLKIDEFSFSSIIIGAVSTFYFKPVYAQFEQIGEIFGHSEIYDLRFAIDGVVILVWRP